MRNRNNWKLLPWWAKGISLIYLFIGCLSIIAVILKISGFAIPSSIYGLSSSNLFSVIGIGILLIFALKGYVGYLLLTGNFKATKWGIGDSIVGISICIFTGLIWPFFDEFESVNIVIRLEFFILIPLLLLFIRLKNKWNSVVIYELEDHAII